MSARSTRVVSQESARFSACSSWPQSEQQPGFREFIEMSLENAFPSACGGLRDRFAWIHSLAYCLTPFHFLFVGLF